MTSRGSRVNSRGSRVYGRGSRVPSRESKYSSGRDYIHYIHVIFAFKLKLQ